MSYGSQYDPVHVRLWTYIYGNYNFNVNWTDGNTSDDMCLFHCKWRIYSEHGNVSFIPTNAAYHWGHVKSQESTKYEYVVQSLKEG